MVEACVQDCRVVVCQLVRHPARDGVQRCQVVVARMEKQVVLHSLIVAQCEHLFHHQHAVKRLVVTGVAAEPVRCHMARALLAVSAASGIPRRTRLCGTAKPSDDEAVSDPESQAADVGR